MIFGARIPQNFETFAAHKNRRPSLTSKVPAPLTPSDLDILRDIWANDKFEKYYSVFFSISLIVEADIQIMKYRLVQ